MPQHRFYATRADADLLLDRIEPALELTYYPTGVFATPDAEPHSSLRLSARQPLATSLTESNSYLGLPPDVALRVRAVPQVQGGVLYAVDELVNPDAITLSLGSEHDASTLIGGFVGATSCSEPSKKALAVFDRALRKHFVRVKAYHVGPQALALLRSGGRLTPSVTASALIDLREGA